MNAAAGTGRTPDAMGEPRRLTPLEEAALTGPTRDAEDDDEVPVDDAFAAFFHEAMQIPDTATDEDEQERRAGALEEARRILGPASSGSFGTVQRPVVDLVYVATWLLDTATPVHLPGACESGSSDA